MDLAERLLALDEFYGQLQLLERAVGGKRILSECDGRMKWPRRGVYFFFEDGEFRDDGVTPRVVRVGTHALRPSKSTLWGRLSQHKGNVGGSMPGGGNHRGSIFRLHVGTALLTAGDWPEAVRLSWGFGNTAKGVVREGEYPVEVAVSQRVGSMPFLWVDVDDEPDYGSDRGVIESGAIALLSNAGRPAIDPPASSWLGQLANREAIRTSGLWNVEHVQSSPSVGFLDVFSRHVGAMAPE
ncbi:MAG: hypothetical protein HKL85_01855 [Acidimicrobiaceae bacterium]|nr:hypothetical protein [Acidimicrobiaceae bacterium]